jgi:hypothetical protein
MKKIFLTLLLILMFSYTVKSQENNPIVTAVPSLSIAPDARAGGMGDIGAATDPDINSQYWNASKYVFMESDGGLSVSYTPWLRKLGISDIDLGYLAGYWKFNENQAVSASLRYFSLGDIELMNQLGYSEGSAHPNELAFDVAYSMKLSENLSGGVTLRYIRSDLNNGINTEGSEMYPGNAFAADISSYYRKPIDFSTGSGALAFGLNISNVGSKISYDGGTENNFLPTNLRLGSSLTYPIDDYQKVSVSIDVNKLLVPTPDSISNFNTMSPLTGIFRSFSDAPDGFSEELREIMWSLGAEYVYNNQFAVRAGYYNESQYKGNRKYFTAGAGFKLNVFQIDAAYVISTSQSNPLDQTLRLSLSFDMFGLKNLIK